MIPFNRNMTISDYFALVKNRFQSGSQKGTQASAQPMKASDFAKILTAMAPSGLESDDSGLSGLSIADYRKQALTTRIAAAVQAQQQAAAAFDENESIDGAPGVDAAIRKNVRRAADKYGVPENLINGVIRAESAYDAKAVSQAGAKGLMQLMPATAKELGVTEPFDIEQNIDGGTRYLKQMLDRFDGNIKLALSAYNAGPANVEKYNGEVPFKETRQYVKRVLKYSSELA